MPVYVDDMKAAFGRMKMCHMVADSHDELVAMADAIGVARRWIQHEGTTGEHFDIALSKRALAIKAGAVLVTWLDLGRRQMALNHGKPWTPARTDAEAREGIHDLLKQARVVAASVEDAIDTSRCRLGALCPGCEECNTDRVAEPTEEAGG